MSMRTGEKLYKIPFFFLSKQKLLELLESFWHHVRGHSFTPLPQSLQRDTDEQVQASPDQ